MPLFLENEMNRVLCDAQVRVSTTVEGTIQISDIKLLWLKGLKGFGKNQSFACVPFLS